ncbi:hypothetical protein ScalyP_jg10202 [Parmales sp. scaly parma]|nr:hypothetical protein ScalyP_jg10202 [Parmales sp. scaly parma]
MMIIAPRPSSLALLPASSKALLKFVSLSPAFLLTTSPPLMVKTKTSASEATARAREVLPTPEGPVRRTPRGGGMPKVEYSSGCRRGVRIREESWAIWGERPPREE